MAKKQEDVNFTKHQLVKSKKFSENQDAVNALLKDGELYTIKQVEELLNSFMKGEK